MKLALKEVTKTFTTRAGQQLALKDISLECREGEFLCIVGPSGCGKSTLLRIIDGLVPADGGGVLIDGRLVSQPGTDRALVFQRDCLFPWRTVRENVVLGLEIQGTNKKSAMAAAQVNIELVGLKGFEGYYPHELSGGMRQRVNLARALTTNPAILLMDEPFASLDAQTREIMQAEVLRIWEGQRKTVIFVTHQIEEAIYLADRVVVMTARPGLIKDVVDIDLPRPRLIETKLTEAFLRYQKAIHGLIQEEVLRALGLERSVSSQF